MVLELELKRVFGLLLGGRESRKGKERAMSGPRPQSQ